MRTITVNLSFRKDLLEKIDKIAKAESRSRSELIRESVRMYIERKERWRDIFFSGDAHRKIHDLKETDISKEIQSNRKRKLNPSLL